MNVILREKSNQSMNSFHALRGEKNRRFVSYVVKDAK